MSPTPIGLVCMEEERISTRVCGHTGEGPCENREDGHLKPKERIPDETNLVSTVFLAFQPPELLKLSFCLSTLSRVSSG